MRQNQLSRIVIEVSFIQRVHLLRFHCASGIYTLSVPGVLPHTSHLDQVTTRNHQLAFIGSGKGVKRIHAPLHLFTTWASARLMILQNVGNFHTFFRSNIRCNPHFTRMV